MDITTYEALKASASYNYLDDQPKRTEAIGLIEAQFHYENILAVFKHLLPVEKYQSLAKTTEEEYSKIVTARRVLVPDPEIKPKK